MKIYDKGGRVLRIEVVVHNAKELRSGRMLERLPALLQRMRDTLIRFLGTIQAAHISVLDVASFESLTEPTARGTRRLAGIDLSKARNRHVVGAVLKLSTKPDGFHRSTVGGGRMAVLRSTCQHLFGAQRGLRRGKNGRKEAAPTDRAITSLRRSSARRSSSHCWPASSAPVAGRRNTAPLWTNITSHCAKNSIEPFKPSASPPPSFPTPAAHDRSTFLLRSDGIFKGNTH